MQLPQGYMPVTGACWKVSSEDVRAAVAAYESDPGHYRTYRVQVISPDEIHIYSAPDVESYFVVERIKGKWEFTSKVIVTS